MEPQNISPAKLESDQVIDDPFMKWLKEERCASERSPVQALALLVTQRVLDYVDAEICIVWIQFPPLIIQVSVPPCHGLFQLSAGPLPSVPDALSVLPNF